MFTQPTESWDATIETFRKYVEDYGLPLAPTLELARRIAASPFAEGLFPHTSMHDLILAQTDEILAGQDRLLVTARPGPLTFVYTDHQGASLNPDQHSHRGYPSWHASYQSDEGFEALTRFLDRVGWFPKHVG